MPLLRRLLSPALALALLPAAAAALPVEFRVDMGPCLAAGYFDPATDRVELRGDFSDWNAVPRPARPVAGGPVYAVTMDLPPGAVRYKFTVVRGGGAVVWEDHVADRHAVVHKAGQTLPAAAFDDLSEPPAPAVLGADLSYLPQWRGLGAAYSASGRSVDPLTALADAGHRLARLRLWHSPAAGRHGTAATLAFAREAQAAGFDVMLDLHYSDTWADPGRQAPPAAWSGLDADVLADSVRAYTAGVVRRFVDAGVTPRYVQIGNEIDGGLLWDAGRVGWRGSVWDTPAQWENLATLLRAAAAGVRDGLPSGARTAVVVHCSQGGDNAVCRRLFDRLRDAGVDHDAIGVSWYPWWHGGLWQLDANLRDLRERYGKELLVVETAYPWTLEAGDATGNFVTAATALPAGYPASPAGQRDYLRDVRRVAEGAGCTAVLFWEPAMSPLAGSPPNPCENLALFDFAGRLLPAAGFGRP